MNWKPWLHSLAAAAIGGFSSAVVAVVATGKCDSSVLKIGLVGAILPVLTLLKQSPLPPSK